MHLSQDFDYSSFHFYDVKLCLTVKSQVLVEFILGHLWHPSLKLSSHRHVQVQILHILDYLFVLVFSCRFKHRVFVFLRQIEDTEVNH
jgi:hypothetical protein